jgi:excisionase family DNA binding protein
MDHLLTPEQIAELLGVKVSTIYQWTHQEYIPHIKLGRFVRFRQAEIEKWLDKKLLRGRKTRRISILE